MIDVETLRTVAVTVLAIFAIIGIGAFVRWRGWLTATADASILALLVRLLFPALIIQQTLANRALREPANLWQPPLLALGAVGVGWLIAWLVVSLLPAKLAKPGRLETAPARRTFVACTGLFNYGYVPIPLIASLYASEATGGDGGGTLGVLFVFNVGLEVAMWTGAIAILSGGNRLAAGNVFAGGWHRRLLSPPIVAVLVGVGLNLASAQVNVNDWPTAARGGLSVLGRVMDLLAPAAIPVALVLTGATIIDDVRQANLLAAWRTVILGCLLRLVVIPPAFWVAVWLLPISDELSRVLIIQAAMPAAIFPVVLARHCGGDPPTALRIIVGTNLLSLITMPLWVAAGLQLLDAMGRL